MTNGDRLTGQVKFQDTTLQASWGDVPLGAKGFVGLEAGKLHEGTIRETRRSPDRRSIITIARRHFRFQPSIESPSTSPMVRSMQQNGQLQPSASIQYEDVQYFMPGPEFKLTREAAAMKAFSEDQSLDTP